MLSIIIATVNRPKLVQKCIDSIAARSGEVEIVVIDQSDFKMRIKAQENLKTFSMPRLGLSAARNKGIELSCGSIVAFVDDDAYLHPNYLQVISEFMNKNSGADAVAGRVIIEDTEIPYAHTQNGASRKLKRGDWMSILGGNLVFRRSTLKKIGVFDERFGSGSRWGSGDESDYFFRMIKAGMWVTYLPELIVYHPREDRGHTSTSLCKKLYGYGKGQGALFAKHLCASDWTPMMYWIWSISKPLIRMLQYAVMGKTELTKVQIEILRGRFSGFFEYAD